MPQNNNEDLKDRLIISDFNSTSSSSDDAMISLPSGSYFEEFQLPERPTSSVSYDASTSDYDLFEISQNASNFLEMEEKSNQKSQFINFENLIESTVRGYDPNLPKIKVKKAQDESITISWRFGDIYFGVSIYENEDDSTWTLIQGGNTARGYASDGYLNDPNFLVQFPILFRLMKSYQ